MIGTNILCPLDMKGQSTSTQLKYKLASSNCRAYTGRVKMETAHE